ncbi:hypothetical protein V5F77_06095 [Xanthobacter sp. DSM 24535]|uniref:hypothetical protein n=1 Tax=Roseixanthobacter psychrophilus TaxID=3119917 RepID=UPI003728A3CE
MPMMPLALTVLPVVASLVVVFPISMVLGVAIAMFVIRFPSATIVIGEIPTVVVTTIMVRAGFIGPSRPFRARRLA